MILLIVGLLFIAMGIFSGGVLIAAPLGLVSLSPGVVLWVFFPVFSILGYVLFVMGAKVSNIRGMSMAVSCILLLLAVASAIALVLEGASVLHPVASTLPLWYVFVVAGLIGAIGVASYSKTSVVE
jgi:hypothetical protein